MEKRIPTKYTQMLFNEIKKRGVNPQLEYFDGHKTVDIAILNAKIFIEIDGLHHYTHPEQIKSDFKRNHFSDGDDFDTFHVPNELIKNHLDKIADGIVKVIQERLIK